MKSLFGLVITCLTLNAFAEVKILGIEIPGLHESSGSGVYDIIVNKTVVAHDDAQLIILPPARAEAEFEQCTNCCFSPANKNPEFYDFGDDYVQTKPMNVAKVYIFSADNAPIYNDLNELQNKKIGTRAGMPYGKTFDNANLDTREVSDIEKNVKKLQLGRIDAFVAYVPDAYLTFADMGITELPHNQAKPVAVHEDSLVCKGVSENFIENFNHGLQSLNDSGELKNILGDSQIQR